MLQINDPFIKQFLTLQNNFLTLQIIFQKIDRIQFALPFFLEIYILQLINYFLKLFWSVRSSSEKK